MSALRQALTRYVLMRRRFGYRFDGEEHCLSDFVAFMDAAHATVITRKLAIVWIAQAARASRPNRLSMVRGFARYLSNLEPDTETLPTGIFATPTRPHPYIYTDAEIEQVLEATLSIGVQTGPLIGAQKGPPVRMAER